jgi:hypothetical protein
MNILEFGNKLLQQRVLPARGTSSITQVNDGSIIKVKKLENSPYEELYCWYNCKAHKLKNGGEIAFGWVLDFQKNMFHAQHHAVWISKENEYIDVTPSRNEETTFLIDGRAPFCYETYRHPPNFYYEPKKKLLGWGDIEKEEMEPDYYIGRPVSKDDPYIIELLGEHA